MKQRGAKPEGAYSGKSEVLSTGIDRTRASSLLLPPRERPITLAGG